MDTTSKSSSDRGSPLPRERIETLIESAARYFRNCAGGTEEGVDVDELIADMATALSTLQRAQQEARAWQPIETAKRDGTRIILGRKQAMSGAMIAVSGHWNSGGAYHMPHWSTASILPEPTHWMPLPDPPQETP